ncbi:hypothetical protein FHS57_006057 [Runella defluvii]|uniref:LamG-like jellyroll fold domain-containing protein n=1 Tax=Runella defluvii TaxID=370973 RepID=A0A7W5ZQZ3_9BACT|nr:LamG-like jellyroll fold domain-containing protein [Runella defluvii]MBB3842028.1 hypothetical protein [Runella defluvii]
MAPTITATSDGGFVIAGTSSSGISGDKSDAGKGGNDDWIIKLNSNGQKAWDKTIGTSNYDFACSVVATSDGGFVISGESGSGISGDKTEANKGYEDYWIVKLGGNSYTFPTPTLAVTKCPSKDFCLQLNLTTTVPSDGRRQKFLISTTPTFDDATTWGYNSTGDLAVIFQNGDSFNKPFQNNVTYYIRARVENIVNQTFSDWASTTFTFTSSPATLKLSATSYSATADAFFQNLGLEASAAWTAQSDASWLTISPTSGTLGFFSQIRYGGDANTTTTARTGTITFTSGTTTAKLVVTQAGGVAKIIITNLPEAINQATYTVPREATVHHYFLAKNSSTNLPVQNVIVNYKIGTQTTIRNSLPSDADGLIDLNVKVGGTDSTSSADDWLGVGSGTIQYVGLTNATLSGQNDFATNPFTINVIDKASPLDKEMGIGVGFRVGAPLFELPYDYKKKIGSYTLSFGSSISGKLGMSTGRQIRIKPVSGSAWDIYFSGNLGVGLDLAGEAGFTFGDKNIKAGANTSLDTELEGGTRFEKGYRIDLNNRTDVLKLGYLVYSLHVASPTAKAISLIFENLYNKYSTTPLTNNSLTTRREFSYGANYNFDLDTELKFKVRAKGFNLPGYGNIPEIEPQYKVESKGGFLDTYILESEKGVGNHTINSIDVDFSAVSSIQSMVNITKGNRKNNPSAKSQPFELYNTSIDNNLTVGRTVGFDELPKSSFFSLGTRSTELTLDPTNSTKKYNVIINNQYKYGPQVTSRIFANYYSTPVLQNNALAKFITMNTNSLVWSAFTAADNTRSVYKQALDLHDWVTTTSPNNTPFNEIDLTSTRDISLIEKQEASTDLSKYKINIFKIKLDLAGVNLSSWSTHKHNLSKAVYVKSLNRALLTLDYPNITNNLEIPTTHPLLMIENAINSVLGGIDDNTIAESDDFMERTSAFVDELVDILWTNLWKPRKNSAGVTIYDPKQSLSTQSARIAANTPSVFTFTIPKTAFYANTKLDFDYYYPANEIEAITTTDTLRIISDVFTISATLNNTKLLNAPRANFNIQTVFSQTDLELASLPTNLVPIVVFLPHGSTVWEKIGTLNTTFSFNRLGTYALAVKITNDDTPPTINVTFPSTFTAPNYIDVTLNDTQSGIDWAKVTFAANDLPVPYTRQGLTNTFRVNISDLPTNANGIFNFYILAIDLAGNPKTYQNVYPCDYQMVISGLELDPDNPILKKALATIQANSKTPQNKDVLFRAGKSIELTPGFETKGKTFMAQIGGCATSTLPTNGLIAYYPFTGNTNDASGNNRNATNNGATLTTDRKGTANAAYDFNGSNAWLNTPLVQSNLSGYTISAWVKPNFTNSQEYVILQNRGTTPGSGRSLTLHYQYSTNRWGFAIDGDALYTGVQAPSTNTTEWIHVVGVWSSGGASTFNANQFKVYVNGVLLSAVAINGNSATIPNTGSGTVAIGRHEAWGSYFKGKLDDIRIYNRALTDAEVQSIYTIER